MDGLSKIVLKRSAPGILIFDLNDRLLYSNGEALEMLAALKRDEAYILEEIHHLCRRINGTENPLDAVQGTDPYCPVLAVGLGIHCALRAMLLSDHGGSNQTHIMVLMERIVEKRQVDIDKARREFDLSKREAEVVYFICQGLANREVAEEMFISEFTVKDHIKKIMKKMRASSRNEIVALLK